MVALNNIMCIVFVLPIIDTHVSKSNMVRHIIAMCEFLQYVVQ